MAVDLGRKLLTKSVFLPIESSSVIRSMGTVRAPSSPGAVSSSFTSTLLSWGGPFSSSWAGLFPSSSFPVSIIFKDASRSNFSSALRCFCSSWYACTCMNRDQAHTHSDTHTHTCRKSLRCLHIFHSAWSWVTPLLKLTNLLLAQLCHREITTHEKRQA